MIVEIDPLSDPRWAEFVDNHPLSSPFHSTAWLRSLQDSYGYRPVVLTTSASNEDLKSALVYCEVDSWITGRRLVSVPFADHCSPLVDNAADMVDLVSALAARASSSRCRYAEVRMPESSRSTTAQPCTVRKFAHHVLDVRAGTDAVFAGFHKDCIQRKIRRAGKEQVTVEREDDIDPFFRLHLLTRRRHRLPPQPVAWFRNIARHFRTSSAIWVARYGGEPIAAIMTLRHGHALYYKYGASDQRFHPIGAMPLLFAHLVEHAAALGCDTIDLGRSDLADAGLIAFKERLGAAASTLAYCRFPADSSRASNGDSLPMRVVQKVCAVAPDRCLILLGAILYRHSA